jgi:DNA repair exonuclease SbcCD ATPase subunit
MGLFSRKPKEPTNTASAEQSAAPSIPAPEKQAKNKKQPDAERVQAELDAMKERLAAAERSKADLEARLRVLDDFNASLNSKILVLDEANVHLDGRLDAIDQGVTMLGGRIETLTGSTERLTRRMLAVDDLDARLIELTDRIDQQPSSPTTPTPAPPAPVMPASPPPPPPAAVAPPPPPTGDDGRLDDVSARLELLAAAVAAHTEQMTATQARMDELDDLSELMGAADERLSSADARITSVSTELANQLTELSRDIDELNRRSAEAEPGTGTSAGTSTGADIDTAELEARLAERLDSAIEDVLDTTEKLAAEQARYEIQFRADLAELAERLRRPGTT